MNTIAWISFLLLRVQALLSDAQGTMDWYYSLTRHQEHVGTPHTLDYNRANQRPHVAVGTDHGIIANINLKTSDITWRQALEGEEIVKVVTTDSSTFC